MANLSKASNAGPTYTAVHTTFVIVPYLERPSKPHLVANPLAQQALPSRSARASPREVYAAPRRPQDPPLRPPQRC